MGSIELTTASEPASLPMLAEDRLFGNFFRNVDSVRLFMKEKYFLGTVGMFVDEISTKLRFSPTDLNFFAPAVVVDKHSLHEWYICMRDEGYTLAHRGEAPVAGALVSSFYR